MPQTPDSSEHPAITLAGKEYKIKPLVLRQLRVVVPALLRLGKLSLTTISQQQFDDMIEIIYQAICYGQQQPLSREDFMGMEIRPGEMLAAIPVIVQQTGMIIMKQDAPVGEEEAGSPRTGTES